MKLPLLVLFLSAVSVTSTISGDITDTAVCGDYLIESECEFEADPDRRRRLNDRRRQARLAGRKMKKESEDEGEDGFLNKCTVFIDGVEANITITDLDYCIVEYDEDVKGDDTKLELFQSVVKVYNSTIQGLYKLETFEYDDPNSDDDDDTLTTLKTFSVAWSGCS